MEEQALLMEALYEKAKDYTNTKLEIAKLKAVDKASDLISTLILRFIMIVLLLIFIIGINIALSLWLGELMGKSYYGFLAVSGFYLLVALIIHFLLKPAIRKNISNAIVSRLIN